MKKKIIASLVAACMFVGMAVPTFAAFNSSSQTGLDEEITAVSFKKASYTVKNTADVDLKAELAAYVGTKKIVEDPTLEWSIEDDGANMAFTIDENGKAFCSEDKGSATVTVKANEGKVKATVKLVAAKNTITKATSFKIEKVAYDLPVNLDKAEDVVIKIVPQPTNSVFSDAQKAYLKDATKTVVAEIADGTTPTATASVKVKGIVTENDDHDIILTYAADGTKGLKVLNPVAKQELRITADKFPNYDSTATTKLEKTAKVTMIQAVAATKIGQTGSITIEVGQTFDAATKIKFGPSNANVGKKVTWSNGLFDESTSEADDYAVLDGAKVKGIAVGKNKVVATLASNGEKSAAIVVNVVEKGKLPTPSDKKPSMASLANMIVGGSYKIAIKDAGDAKVTFSSYNDKVATVAADGTVKAIAAGTVKIKAMVGTEALYVNVTVKAAPAVTNPTTTKPTTPAQTGVSCF